MKDYIDKNGLKTIGEYINEQDKLLSQQVATKQDVLTTTNVPDGENESFIGFDSNNALKKQILLKASSVDIDLMFIDIDPILENNSWATIRAACEAGLASNYWQVGDTKTVTGGDGRTRNVVIVDMSGMYGKNVVFQFRDLTEATYVWNASNSNAYATCEITSKLAPEGDAFVELMDSVLGDLLTDTSFKVATSGEDSTLVTATQKLFLPAEKEVTGTRHYSVQAEFDALSTFAFYTGAGDTNANRILKSVGDQTAHGWWERSPRAGGATSVCFVNYDGDLNSNNASNVVRLAPCFAF